MPKRAYPYLPHDRTILYLPEDNEFIIVAKANREPLIAKYPESVSTSSVIVKSGQIIGQGTNKPIHKSFCPRTVFGSPSGQDYELCKKYCHSDNHSEAAAIRDARTKGHDTKGADFYLYGHWWLCKPCWDKIFEAGIKNVFLVEGAEDKFYQAVSSKGEPDKALTIFVDGKIPDDQIPELLKRVKITISDEQENSDFTFTPDDNLSPQEFVVALHRTLDDTNVYGL